MCGICGMATRDGAGEALDEERLRKMTDAIVHRGPDERGTHIEPGIALGMRRLSIIDVAGSHQPIVNEDGSVLAVFNGEIYNYKALREDLVKRGHRLRTAGDGEVIVHLYEEYGVDFARHLSGIFAVALWDASRRRLVLVRDQFGVKPLYYSFGPGGLAFASEVKALIVGGLLQPSLDPLAAELFLAFGFVPGPRSLFAGVEKLMPASLVVWEGDGQVEQRSYWSAGEGASPRSSSASWEDDQSQLLELLRRSTRAQMVSDVPLGSMLSGGLDSSLITALMAEHSSRPVKTFSIGFVEDADANELGDARSVAERLGTDHHELLTSATEHPELLDEAMWHLEEPIADVSFLGFMLLSRLARESVTVALSGQGADELLGGYRKHQIAALAAALAHAPSAARGGLAALGRRAAPGSTLARGIEAVATDDPALRLLAMSRILQPADRMELLSADFRAPYIEGELSRAIRAQLPCEGESALGQTLALDTRMALVDNMLLYFDKMSMASSLEVRVPFLDTEIAGFCAHLPDQRKVWLGRRKELLKRASRGLVDEQIIGKRKRGFFHSALGAWLRVHSGTLLSDTLLDPRALARGQYDATAVRGLLAGAGAGGKKSDQRLFCLMLLERWQQLFVDGDAIPAERPAVYVVA
ncbi:MAG TPA: asparagine synthase (glutamine-hydrolyzing) [Solirubrobacteraceae bacterium]|jgi:asparagine synthase (glutamine-hydrolysing)|nr:asparagine synthase (glutamine-hydrolyzing) [Solirubrobacteraceae bacterium]